MRATKRVRPGLVGTWLVGMWLGCGTLVSGQTLSFTEYAPPYNDNAYAMTTGPDGAMWFTYTIRNEVGRITTEGAASFFSGPDAESYIAAGPDGALWLSTPNNAIKRMNTSGVITNTYALSGALQAINQTGEGIVAGPDGAMWFTAYSGGNVNKGGICRITTTGTLSMYPLSPTAMGGNPNFIAAGPDGALWFTLNTGNAIGRIDVSGNITLYPVTPPARTAFWSITPGPDGALWFTEPEAQAVGRITTSGSVTQYQLPGALPAPWITAGSDGALWVAPGIGAGNNAPIIRITTSGSVTTFTDTSDPVAGNYSSILTGPDGALWLAGAGMNGFGSSLDAIFRVALTQPNGFFTDEQTLGTLFYLQFQDGNPFGYYGFLQGSAATASAWLYHFDLGYEYVTAGDAAGDLYFYDLVSTHWWYTSSSLFPYVYDFTLNSWLYYFPNTSSPGHYTTNPRYFSNLTTDKIISM
jgi:virginiamycin B lyase